MMRPISRVIIAIAAVLIAASASVSADAPEEARQLIEQGRIAEAYARLQAWVARVPDDPLALVLLASIEFDGTRSQEYYRRARQADPAGETAADALLGIARYYYARGLHSTATRLAQELVDTFSGSGEAPWATLLVGQSLLAAGQPAEAAEALTPLPGSDRSTLRVAATGVWAEAVLADRRPQEVIALLSAPAWSSSPYELSLLAEAFRASGQDSKARDIRRRTVLASRSWMGDSLRHGARAVPTSRAAESRSVPPQQAQATQPPQPLPQRPAERERQAPEPAPTESESASGNSFRGGPEGYSLQVGAFGSEENAVRLQRRLHEAGFEVVVRRTGSLHRVWVGNYVTVDAARAAMPEVGRASGLKPAIVRNR